METTRRNFFKLGSAALLVLTLSRCSWQESTESLTSPTNVPTPAAPDIIVWNPFNPELVDRSRIGDRFIARNDASETDIFGVLRKNKIEPTSMFAKYVDIDDGNKEKHSWIVTALNGQPPPLGWVIIVNGFHYFAHPSQDPWTAVKIPPLAIVEIYFAKKWDGVSV